MKKIHIIPGILAFMCIFMLKSKISSGQEDISPPELLNATIINEAGDVQLKWKLTDTIEFDIQIERDSFYNVEDFVPRHIITDTSIKTWIDNTSDANNQIRAYRVKPNLSGNIPASNKFNTILTTAQFDTCRKSNSLNWSRYIPPTPLNDNNVNDTIHIKHYNIWKSTDGSIYQKIATTGDTSFTDTDVFYNHIYKYYVESVRQVDTSIKSMSNRVIVETRMPYNPDYIHTDYIKTNNNTVDLKYSVASNSELNRYYLLRGNSYNGTYDTIKKFKTTSFTLNYEDQQVNPDKAVNYYQVVSVNQCGDLTTRSGTLHNILLNAENNDMTNKISWNQVKGTHYQTKEYKVFRKIGNNLFNYLQSTYSGSYYDNDLDFFRGRDSSGRFCYYINTELTATNHSALVKSNKKCLYIQPEIFVPNAFTPNGDGLNDKFRPYVSFLPSTYHLIIYNRRGIKVYETKSADDSWHGLIEGKGKAPGGTYIYYLKVNNPEHQMIERRGKITVLYP